MPSGIEIAPPRRYWKVWVSLAVLAMVGGAGYATLTELMTSEKLAPKIANYAQTLNYTVQPGPSDAIRFPTDGPFDTRLGYVQLPTMLERLQQRGLEIEAQSRFSSPLLQYTQAGLFPPYSEKTQSGLQVADCRGNSVYSFEYPRQTYDNFGTIPPLVVNALLFIENRELLDESTPYANPAVDWVRFTRAAFVQAAKAIGIHVPQMGGSTLATQIEKYRHSPDGVTSSATDKLRQMASATVRIYQQGEKTLEARRQLVLHYLNTVPLSAAPGYGEVNGLADGLRIWLAADFDTVNALLAEPDGDALQLQAKGQALRQVIALMIAHRRPSYYLNRGRNELDRLTDSYLRILARADAISPGLRDAGLAQRISFRNFRDDPAVRPIVVNKGANVARNRLSDLLGAPLYDLDRMDLAVDTTLQRDLQEDVSAYLASLGDPKQAEGVGLIGERLLKPEGTPHVRYSFTLFERTSDGNRVRVQTDNTSQPFDINEGSKLELGSTAKLRVMTTYLEIVAELHQRYAQMPAEKLQKIDVNDMDNLSRWAIGYLAGIEDKSLPTMLQAALDRQYSASPQEAFFTGGGMHRFGNFRREDNGRVPTMRESLRESINLPFVRLMRDIVKYSMNNSSTTGGADDRRTLLSDDSDPRRKEYLARFADREGLVYLQRFWNKYRNKTPQEQLDTFLDGLRQNEKRLSAVHRFLFPDADVAALTEFLHQRLPDRKFNDKEIAHYHKQFGPGAFSLADQAYVARVHPLELWLLAHLQQHPGSTLGDAIRESAERRQEVYAWLFRTRAKNARDTRVRIMLEVEAFSDIHQRWKRVGYPFDHMVPSLGSALGSSGDRPAALAELMGIILNDGMRLPTVRIDHLHFAKHTPYDTSVRRKPVAGEQVMAPEVAQALRGLLAEVVTDGTARRLAGGYVNPDGTPLVMGGKTGTGDNRIVSSGAAGIRTHSRAMSRTATFVFFLGERHFGTLTAFVVGEEAGRYSFTSALPVQVLRGMGPILQPYLEPGKNTYCTDGSDNQSVVSATLP